MKYVFRGIMYVTRGIGERRKVGNVGCGLIGERRSVIMSESWTGYL